MKNAFIIVAAALLLAGCQKIQTETTGNITQNTLTNTAVSDTPVDTNCGQEGKTLGSEIDHCCPGLEPKSLRTDGGFGGLIECAKITNEPVTSEKSTIANPASENCTKKGGILEIRKNKNGEYGVCIFDDNRQCEEWALFRGQCPDGGVKVTGYLTDGEIYCAITGGQIEGVGTETPMCKRFDGTLCNAQANFNGECPDPNDPIPSAGNREAD